MPTLKPVSISTQSPDGARAFFQHAQQTTTRLFRARGKLTPMAFTVGHRDPTDFRIKDKPTLSMLGLDPSFMKDGDSKDKLVGILRQMAVGGEAWGVVFVAESWALMPADQATMRKYLAREDTGSIADRPDRKEILWMIGQHRSMWPEGIWASIAHIVRPRKGRARLTGWQDVDGASQGEGRFNNLLPPPELYECVDKSLSAAVQVFRSKDIDRDFAVASIRKMVPFSHIPGEYLAQRLREMDW